MPRVSDEEAQEIQNRIEGLAKSSVNNIQVGGDHYRKVPGEQHWDRMWRLRGRGYFIGNITAYVERYDSKNGIEDLKKALHYITKLIELEEAAINGTGVPPGGGDKVLPKIIGNAMVVDGGRIKPSPLGDSDE